MSDPGSVDGSNEDLRLLLLDSITDYAIFTLDTCGRVTSWNPGAENLKGYSACEIIGQHFSRFYSAEDRAAGKPAQMLQRALTDGRVEDEGWRVRKNGSRFWASVVISAMYDSGGTFKGFAKITRDLSERRRAEETRLQLAQLREAARVRDEFLAYISHEMRTPLANLQLQLELLRQSNSVSPTATTGKIVERLDRSYTRLAELVDSVLEQSKIHAGRVMARRQPIDLVVIATEVVEELRPAAERKGLRLDFKRQIDSCVLDSDAHFLRVILVNLIGNAVKFTSRGAIEVVVSLSGAENRICVRDEGPGIRAEDQRRIFEPFERVESPQNKHTAGFGLGLATSKRLSEALGARIELHSEPGRGSIFTLVLPSGDNDTRES